MVSEKTQIHQAYTICDSISVTFKKQMKLIAVAEDGFIWGMGQVETGK